MRGSLQEWSAVLHLHLDNKHDRVSANHSLLRIRLCLWVTPADRGPVMCAPPLSSLRKFQFLQNSNPARHQEALPTGSPHGRK